MGILKEALNKGLITVDEYDELAELLKDEWQDMSKILASDSIWKVGETLAEFGLDEYAEEMFDLFAESEEYYRATQNPDVYFDTNVMRWRDMYTGRFVRIEYESF